MPTKKPTPEAAPQVPTGAPAVLAVAAQWEARDRADVEYIRAEITELSKRRHELNPEDDGREWAKEFELLDARLEAADKRWKRNADMLWKFDKSVAPEKRSSEEQMTRQEGSRFASMFTITMRTAVERLKENIVPRIRESATNEEGFMIVDKTMSDEFTNAVRLAVANDLLPAWVGDAVEGAL